MTSATAPRPPRQLRSRETLDRILDATERRLASSGMTGLDLRAVCADAGLTTGAVYSRYAGKAGLLDALFDRFDQRVRVASAEFAADIDRGRYRREAVAVEHFVALLDQVYRTSGAVIAALMEGSYERPELGARAVAMMNDAADLLHLALDQQGVRVDRERAVAATRLAFAWFDQQLFLQRIGAPGDREAGVGVAREAMLAVLGAGLGSEVGA